MPVPVIGITTSYTPADNGKFGTVSVGESYIQAVLQAGGAPVGLPVGLSQEDLRAVFAHLDGVVFSGGGDVALDRFQGRSHPRVGNIDPRRDELEISLVRMAVAAGKPFLGICRGIQVINVALGGTLFTDIGDQLANPLRHDWYPDIPRDYLAHSVSIAAGSRLAEILGGESAAVNSLHHQGIDRLAPGLTATAHAPDSLIEGVELPESPFAIGVQWHPEWLQEHPPQRWLFQALVKAAQQGE